MVTGDMIVAMTDAIKQKVQSFCESRDFSRLTPELAEEMAGGIKEAISSAGAMGYQAFLKSYEVHEPSLEVGGEAYRFKRPVEKRYVTPFGPMILPRNMFQNKSDTKTHFPLDVAWGMVGEFMTVEVREAVLFSSAFVTPEETKTLLEKSALFVPSATAIKHVLAGSLDGANVLLNEKGVKRGRPSERPTGEQRTITPTAYKNAMVGSISFYGEVPEGERTPQRLACHYTAHMPEDHAPTFKARFEAEMRDAQDKCEPGVVKLLLLDAARPLWNYVDNTPLFDDYEKGIDYCHTLEHLSKAGEALFGKDSTPAKAWYDKYRKVLLENDTGAQSVIRSIDYHANTRKLSRAAHTDLDTQRTFFQRNRHRMPYAEFRRRGLPIGSGPVEAACKTLVKARLCRSGMRWSRQGGQHVLDLRTYVKSNRWDAAWKKIKTLLKVA